jgi:hypothetical protein
MGEWEGLFYVLLAIGAVVYFVVTTDRQREQYLLYAWIALIAMATVVPLVKWATA